MASDGCLLVMIIDINPQLAMGEGNACQYLSACISFANFHLATNVKNRLAFIAADHRKTEFLFPSVDNDKVEHQKDGRLEFLGHMDENIIDKIRMMVTSDDNSNVLQTESLISGALGRALLYIKRQETLDAVLRKICARILVITSAGDAGGQYLNYINMYLTAQKMNTSIDVCVVGNDCGLLQQGADITGGYYYRIDNIEELLQVLIMMYHCDVDSRKKLNLPPPESVDYRAACFCHRTLVDMGNVCSNCLSVYCKAVPLCSTCNVLFQVDMPTRKINKKKR